MFAAVCLLLGFGNIGRADDTPAARATPLTPGESITVQVVGQPDATSVYVSDDGTINVPLVGNVQVAGMTPTLAAEKVAKALKDGGYFVNPHVNIVAQPRSQVVTVLGEVRNTGRFPINPGTTIMDLLAQAGGLKETAGEVGYVIRKDDSGKSNRYPVKLNDIVDIKDQLPTSTLLGGDTLLVPVAETYYVIGEVHSPGKFYLDKTAMTVEQAILRAGGITDKGSEHRIEVKRLKSDGTYKVVHLKPGDSIQGDDVIKVKESIF